jgi:hypothetical protein
MRITKELAKTYEKNSWARFIVAIPVVGSAIHEYLMAEAKEESVTPFKNFWGFKSEQIYIVCSQLDSSEGRQKPEPGEFLYLGKYGDIDSLFEVLTSLSKLFPRLNIKFCTDEEFDNLPGNPYANNLILIGGPDYNKIVKVFLSYTPFEFIEQNEETLLRNKVSNQLFQSKFNNHDGIEEVTDYGFFLKMPNPNNKRNKLIILNGIHTYGVYGATKCFLSQDENETNISIENCEEVISKVGTEPNFAVVLKVRSINKKIGIPKINENDIIPL